MTELHMRDARVGDQAAALEVTRLAYQEYAAAMPGHWDEYWQSIVATLGNLNTTEQIVTVREDAIVGTVLLVPTGTVMSAPNGDSVTFKWPEIRLLAVAPAARGLGVGRALVQECVRRARLTGIDAITLHTTDMMQVAMSMYERMGFVRDEELDFHPAPEFTVKGYRYRLDE